MNGRGHKEHPPDRVARAAELLARAEPPSADERLRRRQIEAAIYEAGVSEETSRSLAGWVLGLAGVAAVTILGLWVVLRAPDHAAPRGVVLVSGTLEGSRDNYRPGARVRLDEVLRVRTAAPVRLGLDDGSEIALSARSEVRLSRQSGWKITLLRGETRVRAAPQVAGRRLRVATAEALTTVKGTRFRVSRDPRRGTTVRVSEGSVEVRPQADDHGQPLRGPAGLLAIGLDGKVRSGEPGPPQAPAEMATPVADAGNGADGSAADATDRPPRVGAPHTQPPAVAQIRRKIRGGQIAGARVLIRRGRRVATGKRRYLAELAIVEAEADLAEGRHRRAIGAYLRVDSRFPGTPQAEAALFAAAQVAFDHDRRRAETLLRRYQQRYPTGRFSQDAARLIELVEHAR